MGLALANTGLSGIVDGLAVPETIAGLSMWLDPDFGITVDGSGNLTPWLDHSGNGKNAIQADDEKNPQWTASELGSRSAAVFDGDDDFMATGLVVGTATTVFVIVKKPTVEVSDNWIGAQDTGVRSYIGLHSDGKVGFGIGGQALGVPGLVAPDAMTNGYHLITMRYDGSRVDGWDHLTQIITNHTQSGAANPTRDYYIGARHQTADTAHMPAGIGEVLVYNAALSDANVAIIQNYLIAKWPGLSDTTP